jgi:hypothetical protein
MLNVIKEHCISSGCHIKPHFNYEGETKTLYCSQHKLDGMINIVDRKCVELGCKIAPSFNISTEKDGIYCSKHKKENMINAYADYCEYPDCNITATFNYDGEKKGKYCTSHKKEGMIDIKHSTCIYPGCKTRPSYNKEGEIKGLYCTTHKKEGMVDINRYSCKSSLCYTKGNPKYEGYCLRCFVNLFPDKPNTRNYKTKEKAVADYILGKYPDFSWVTDKKIQDGCSKKRPDLLLDLGYQVIIIEVDENQHQTYDCSCENKRLMELSQDVGHRPIVFIRFNPDDYITKDGKVTSCWGIDRRGICIVKKTKLREWDERLETLGSQIEYWINPQNKTEKTVEAVQLFYDCD